ncbi:hypothetical protein BS47DRAFT_1291101, partial [Hydnum rufescens UP504]
LMAGEKYVNTLVLPESDPYYPNEKISLAAPGCIQRYLHASKWNVEEAKQHIHNTLWAVLLLVSNALPCQQHDYKPDLIPPDEVQVEAKTAKIVLSGFDLEGRPVLYFHPGRENTKESPQQIHHLVFHMWVCPCTSTESNLGFLSHQYCE